MDDTALAGQTCRYPTWRKWQAMLCSIGQPPREHTLLSPMGVKVCMYNLLSIHTVHAHVLQLVVYMLHTTAKKNCFNHLHPYIMTPLLKVFTFNSVFENICFPDCFGVCM